ncbi:hypothetical protein ABKV19_008624 [Rosa sericea]
MAVVEIFLAAFLKVLLNRMTDDFLNFARQGGIDKKLKKWKDILAGIGAVLHDAEEKQLTSEAVKLWLDDLKDLAYDVEDVLDEFSTEMIHRKVHEQQYGATTRKVRGLIPKFRFSFNLNSKIKLITDQLQDISERKDKLGLTYIGTISTNKEWQRPPSSCVLGGTPVVGRDGDKAKIVEFLSTEEPSTINFHVVAIVGMPGLGKTTLAQFIFNDSDNHVLKQFNLKVWVSVSDDFNIVRVTKAILESVTSQRCQWEEFSEIQKGLRNALAGVAKMVRAIDVHNLEYISNDDCWKVFKQHALSDVSNCGPQNFEIFRGEIVAKCGGLPLAARTLGGLLGCKEIHEWGDILENKLWSLSDNCNILPVLNLSYHYLPSDLKRCFAYCSILPNDYEFEEKQLILLWMAEDLIPQPKDNKQLEDLGADYFRELLSRSFFQNSSKSNARYVMHDLISDLARKITGEICFRLEDAQNSYRQIRSSPKARHLSYISGISDGVQKFEAFDQVKHLRTFLPFTVSTLPGFRHCLTRKITHDLVPKLPYLRVLSFNGYGITDLPKSIGELKSLRYLDVSHAVIKDFPESASTLYNLQTLIVNDCHFLRTLPTNMRNLISLRPLQNSKLYLLERMPAQLGSLTNLQTLNNFLVAESGDSGIKCE